MYRQILLSEKHRKFQNILWRENPTEELKSFELNTVGVVSSPFLAIRVLHQLVRDEGKDYPLASAAILRDTYVDDIVTGASSLDEALELKGQLIELLSRGGFPLQKWASNSSQFLSQCPLVEREFTFDFDEPDHQYVKVLGFYWDTNHDVFSYRVTLDHSVKTKRAVLSNIVRIFDPLGCLSPVVFKIKGLIQSLWVLRVDWDDPLPLSAAHLWHEFPSQSHLITQISIPRYVGPSQSAKHQLLGFADASEAGYGAVVYMRVIAPSGEINIYFLAAKSRIAPLKTVTVPKLELSASLLLSRLLSRISNTFRDRVCIHKIFAWTDSRIVLSWLATPPHLLKIFVANRVSEITETIPFSMWRHVASDLNPGDCISRGLMPKQLLNFQLYWCGPPFIHLSEAQ
jgi:hypothetical protein